MSPLWEAGLAFVVGSIGGVLFRLAIGWIVIWGRRHASQDPPVQNTISLLTPFAAYLLAESCDLPWDQLHRTVSAFRVNFTSRGCSGRAAGLYLDGEAPSSSRPGHASRVTRSGSWSPFCERSDLYPHRASAPEHRRGLSDTPGGTRALRRAHKPDRRPLALLWVFPAPTFREY